MPDVPFASRFQVALDLAGKYQLPLLSVGGAGGQTDRDVYSHDEIKAVFLERMDTGDPLLVANVR